MEALEKLWHMRLVAPWHVESSPTRDGAHVPCVGRQILNHWTTRQISIVTSCLNFWYGLNCVPPSKLICWSPKLQYLRMTGERGLWKSWVWWNEVLWVSPNPVWLLSLQEEISTWTCVERRPREHTERSWPSASRGQGTQEKPEGADSRS